MSKRLSPQPSHSLEAEQAVLGSIITDPDCLYDVLALLQPEHFYEKQYGDIFAAILTLQADGQPVDIITLNDHFRDSTTVNRDHLCELPSVVPTTANVIQHAKIIRHHALRRSVVEATQKLAAVAADSSLSSDQIIDKFETELLGLGRDETDTTNDTLRRILDASYERYAALYDSDDPSQLIGINSGFPSLDRLVPSFPAGTLTILAARPSLGKSSLAMDIALHSAKRDKHVLFVSMEMTKEELSDRIVAGSLDVSTANLRQGNLSDRHFSELGKVVDRIGPLPLYINDDPITMARLRSIARRQQYQYGLDLLIVDYLQLIEVDDEKTWENRVQQVSYISRSLKNLASELNVPVIALSQLSRNVENRPDKRPQLCDLRESGSIEQDANIVLMLYRDSYYNEDADDPHVTDVYVRKHRNGPTGRAELHFHAKQMRFVDGVTHQQQKNSTPGIADGHASVA